MHRGDRVMQAAAAKKPNGRPKDRGPLTAAERMRLTRDRRRLLFGLGDRVKKMLEGFDRILDDPDHQHFIAASRLICERVFPVRDALDVGLDIGKVEINFGQLEAEQAELDRMVAAGKYTPLRLVRLPGDAPDEVSNGHSGPHAGAGGAVT